jgi:hypothetical protein
LPRSPGLMATTNNQPTHITNGDHR